jgi:hypothetical protein
MTDFRVATYEIYLSAWSAVPDDERLRLLHESVTEGVVFKNPMKTRAGIADVIEHLEGFQVRSPGGSFRGVGAWTVDLAKCPSPTARIKSDARRQAWQS